MMNILDLLKTSMGDQMIPMVSKFLGESEEATGNAASSILPALLGGLMSKGESDSGAQGILDFLSGNNHDGGILDNIGDLFSSGDKTDMLMNQGSGVLDFLFGKSKIESIIDVLSSVTGFGKGSTGSLLKMVSPLLMGVVGRSVKNKALDAVGLRDLLGGQRSFLEKAAPKGLFDKLGLPGLAGLAGSVAGTAKDVGHKLVDTTADAAKTVGDATVKTTQRTEEAFEDTAKAGGNALLRFLPWVILLLAALLLWWFITGNKDKIEDATGDVMDKTEEMMDNTVEAVGDAADATVDAAGNTVDALVDAADDAADVVGEAAGEVKDAILSLNLPGGAEIKAAEGGFTDKIVKFLSSPGKDPKKAFIFDKVYFNTGSSNLSGASMAQLDNLVKVMESYGKMKIDVVGHTDNTGDAAKNKKLSADRAAAVKNYLLTMKVNASRITSKGLGSDMPVASNDTEEGRAANRRIEVYVLEK